MPWIVGSFPKSVHAAKYATELPRRKASCIACLGSTLEHTMSSTEHPVSLTDMSNRGSVAIELGPEPGEDGKPSAAGWRWIGRELRRPMPTFNARKPGGNRDYITARQVAERLDMIVGPGNWATNWTVVRADHPVVVRYGVALFGVWRYDCGYSNNPDAVDEYIEALDR